MIGQLRILQERAPNTPEPFRAVSSSGFSRYVAWSLWWYKKEKLWSLTCGSYYVSGCELGNPGQETNGFPLLSNSRLAVTGELKKISKEQCI
jgi:hypothetical protein